MKIDFTLTQQDLLEFNKYLMKTQKLKYRTYFIRGLLIAYFIYFFYNEIQRGLDWGSLVIVIIVVGIFYIIARITSRPIEKAVKKSIKNNPDSIGARTIEITDDELIYTTPSMESRFKIGSFDRVEITNELIMVFTGKTHAILLPRSAVSESEIEQIKAKLKVAR